MRGALITALCLWPVPALAVVDASDGLSPFEFEELVISAMTEAGVNRARPSGRGKPSPKTMGWPGSSGDSDG